MKLNVHHNPKMVSALFECFTKKTRFHYDNNWWRVKDLKVVGGQVQAILE